MNRLDFFYGQYVSQADMDDVFYWAELADHAITADTGLTGVISGFAVDQHSPTPDLTVDLAGPGLAMDHSGQRCYCAESSTNLDCSVDEYGVPTVSSLTAGQDRYLAIFVRFKRLYSVPKLDRNGVTVQTHADESFELFVRQGAAATSGTASKVSLLSTALLLADVLVTCGQTQILTEHLDTARREDWVHDTAAAPYVLSEFIAGTPGAAVSALFALLNAHVSDLDLFHGGATITFAEDSAWYDASTLAATEVQAAINEIVSTIAATTGAGKLGSAAHATTGHYCDLVNESVQAALAFIADAVDGHIGGGAPAHPDTAVTSASHDGRPAFVGGTLRAFLELMHDFLTARDTWTFNSHAEPLSGAAEATSDENNVRFLNAPIFKSLQGGTVPAKARLGHLAAGLLGLPSVAGAHPWDTENQISLGDYRIWDMALLYTETGERRVVALANKPAPTTGDAAYALIFDPADMSTAKTIINLTNNADLLPYGAGEIWGGVALCSDGTYYYAMFEDASGNHRVQAFDIEGARRSTFPIGGSVLPGTGVVPWISSDIQYTCYGKIIVTTLDGGTGLASKLATANYWQTLEGGALPLSFVACSTGAVASTRGDAASVATCDLSHCYPIGGLCTDGTSVYASFAEHGTDYGGVISANVNSPYAGSGREGMPLGGVDKYICQELVCDGTIIWGPCANPALHILMMYRLDAPAAIGAGAWTYLTTAALDQMRFLAFDGVNVHVQNRDEETGPYYAYYTSVIRVTDPPTIGGYIPMANVVNRTVSWSRLSEFSAGLPANAYSMGRLLFDGDALLMIQNCQPGDGTWSGVIRRLPRAGLL